MRWIKSIYSILQTWVFKNKVLKFSSRYRRDPQACFYCPEMCRFSCTTAEALRTNAVTPRGKMSLLHWRERGQTPENLAGDVSKYLWFLDQCTSCGRCTEYCLHEVSVGENLREERRALRAKGEAELPAWPLFLQSLKGQKSRILVCEPSRLEWWKTRPKWLERLTASAVVSFDEAIAHLWEEGTLSFSQIEAMRHELKAVDADLIIESPYVGYFFVDALLHKNIRLLWQELYPEFSALGFDPTVSVHESAHLTRSLPSLGISIPMHERGFMPQHFGWNAHDCGGEGFYAKRYPKNAGAIAEKFIGDLLADGRQVSTVICQNLSCAAHLASQSKKLGRVLYWLDAIDEKVSAQGSQEVSR